MKKITDLSARQKSMLAALEKYIRKNGYSPSMRELAKLVNLKSTSSVQYHLEKLEELGYIFRADDRARSIRLIKSSSDLKSKFQFDPSKVMNVPLVGSIAAGAGMIAEQEIEAVFPLPPELTGKGELFALRVSGDSMVNAAILDGDWVIVRSQKTAENGDIVAAGSTANGGDAEATVKYFHKSGNEVILKPANEAHSPICLDADSTVVYGKVISVLRRL